MDLGPGSQVPAGSQDVSESAEVGRHQGDTEFSWEPKGSFPCKFPGDVCVCGGVPDAARVGRCHHEKGA